MVAGILAATESPTLVLLAGGLLVTTAIVIRPQSTRASAPSHRLIFGLLVAYTVPLFAFGREFATIGYKPVFVADVLVVLAALLMLQRLRYRATAPTAPLTLLCLILMLLVGHAVYVGLVHGYSGAVKGLVLGVYPVLAAIFAAWLAQQVDVTAILKWLPKIVLPFAGAGLTVLTIGNALVVPASYGLYLGIGAAFATVPGMPQRRLLIATTAIGLFILVAVDAKRGPVAAVVLGSCAASLAARSFTSYSRRALAVILTLCTLSGFGLLISIDAINPSQLPVAGHLVARATASADSADPSAANNVLLRERMWSYALRTTAEDGPLFGVGAYHPIEVARAHERIGSDPESGVHNSFVGYAFYAGFPAALIVCIVFALVLWRLWTIRKATIYAPALFGSLVVAVVTALTNVALETTYMGGPSWLLVGAGAGLAAWAQRRPTDTPASST